MSDGFVSFDSIRPRVMDIVSTSETFRHVADRLYLIRDLWGKVRIAVSDTIREDESRRDELQHLARALHEALNAHGYAAENGILFVSAGRLKTLEDEAQKITSNMYWVDRLMTGRDWWTVGAPRPEKEVPRWTLFSVKGGVGRSTTAAVLAWHLTRKGECSLVVDLDLESPGLSSALLDHRTQPKFGVTDWFVEDLVGQGDQVVESMVAEPSWADDFEGDVHVVPAHGRDPGEYLAKLGRVYMDTNHDPWTARLERLLVQLEDQVKPTVVLLESRSGLHDIAAATVTDLDAQVLLFARDSESNWTDYEILFRHWQKQGLAPNIRERLSIVSALTPELNTDAYLSGFRERAWDLFRDHLYDKVKPSSESDDAFTFDIDDEDAPHNPIAIHWNRGLAPGTSLRNLEPTTVNQAYASFLTQFDTLIGIVDR